MPRRLKVAYINTEMLATFLGNWQGCDFVPLKVPSSGIPKDVRIVNITFDHNRDALAVTFEHPSFPESEPGKLLPVIEVTFEDARLKREVTIIPSHVQF